MTEREETLRIVNDAIPTLKQIDILYTEATSSQEHLSQMQSALDEKAAKKGLRGVLAFLGGSVIFQLIGSVLLPVIKLLPPAIGDPVLIGLSTVIVIIAVRWVYKLLGIPLARRQADLDRQKAQTQTRMDAISQEIYRLTVQNAEKLNALPRDYCYYDAAVYFERVLANGQADSMKECLSLYEEYLHRQRLEADSRRMLEENQRQSEMLESIRRTSTAAAVNSGVAATFSVLTFASSNRY